MQAIVRQLTGEEVQVGGDARGGLPASPHCLISAPPLLPSSPGIAFTLKQLWHETPSIGRAKVVCGVAGQHAIRARELAWSRHLSGFLHLVMTRPELWQCLDRYTASALD